MILNYVSALLLFVGQLFCSGGCGGGVIPSQNDFRLTLSSGNPVYTPQQGIPTSADAIADTVTFSTDPAWTTGTLVTDAVTSGGLSTGTRYVVRNLGGGVYNFHTTVSGAEANTGIVDITGFVGTSGINPSGVSSTTLKLSPYKGKSISLFDGTSSWSTLTSAEISLALGTLTSGINYDVFAFNNGGTVTMELSTGWGSDTIRSATTLTTQDGVYVKGGATTRRYVGTIRTDSTTTTIDDGGFLLTQLGAKRFVWNMNQRVLTRASVFDSADWMNSTSLIRQANAQTNNRVEFVLGLNYEDFITAQIVMTGSNNTGSGNQCIGIDTTVIYRFDCAFQQTSTVAGTITQPNGLWTGKLGQGYHAINWLESSGSATTTWFGSNSGATKSGLIVTLVN